MIGALNQQTEDRQERKQDHTCDDDDRDVGPIRCLNAAEPPRDERRNEDQRYDRGPERQPGRQDAVGPHDVSFVQVTIDRSDVHSRQSGVDPAMSASASVPGAAVPGGVMSGERP